MAVVQISRIQIRRGKSNSGTGFPQLASGEMGWAIDTQELYIGNGAVSEGAPAVGNTKVLTENDLTAQGNFLNLLQHIYKANDTTIQTGPSVNSPISRTIQDRLDDRVTVKDFGATGNGISDDTEAFQRAINQLFLNTTTKASVNTPAGTSARVELVIPPGIYKLTGTLYVPSYATIIGVGVGKAVLDHIGIDTVIQFVNDTSNIGSPSVINTTLETNQPRYITLKGMTIKTSTGDQTCLKLDAVRNSVFEDLELQGTWASTFNSNSKGIAMNAFSSLVTCEKNYFKNVNIKGFSYAVYAKQDIINNLFRDGYISDVRQGFVFGENANGASIGEQYGPRKIEIINFKFDDVKRHAVYVALGSETFTRQCQYINVGNDGGIVPLYPQVYYNTYGNVSIDDKSDRFSALASSSSSVQYVPEVTGHGSYNMAAPNNVTIGEYSAPYLAFRLPSPTDANGSPIGSVAYYIEYLYKSQSSNFSRQGTLTVIADADTKRIQLSDDYNYAGNSDIITPGGPSTPTPLQLDFSAGFLDSIGLAYTGASGQVPASVAINYVNNLSGDVGIFTYTYKAVL